MPKPDLYIYLDEFERGDTFVLTAAFVPVDKAAALRAEWDELRRKIKRVLMADYEVAKTHRKLQGNALPEIHAVDIYQSKGYYRKFKHGEEGGDNYWLQHRAWFEDALQIILSHNVEFVPIMYEDNIHRNMSATAMSGFSELFDLMIEPGKVKASKKKLEKLLANKYLFALTHALMQLEAYLKHNNLVGEIVCDDHEMSKGFSATASIEWLRLNRGYTHLVKPTFRSGLDESLLQVCDVICYVTGQAFHAVQNKTNIAEPFASWGSRYLRRLMLKKGDFFFDVQAAHMTLIATDLILEQCVSDAEIREQLKDILHREIARYESA